MKKFTGVILTTVFIMAVLLSHFDSYIGSWAFYALGFLMVVFGYIYKGNAKVITKNDHFLVRVEREWKRKVQGISESLGVSSSVFIRECVNKQMTTLGTQ